MRELCFYFKVDKNNIVNKRISIQDDSQSFFGDIGKRRIECSALFPKILYLMFLDDIDNQTDGKIIRLGKNRFYSTWKEIASILEMSEYKCKNEITLMAECNAFKLIEKSKAFVLILDDYDKFKKLDPEALYSAMPEVLLSLDVKKKRDLLNKMTTSDL